MSSDRNKLEAGLIEAVLEHEERALDIITGSVPLEYFSKPARAYIEAAQALQKTGEPVDAVTISDKRSELFPDTPKVELGSDTFISPANLPYHAEKFKKHVSQHQVAAFLKHAAKKLESGEMNMAEALEKVQETAGRDCSEKGSKSLAELIPEHVASIKEAEQNLYIPIRGFSLLDFVLGGWRGGRLYVLAGRTGCGKSAFALNLVHSAAQQRKQVQLVSMEMTGGEILDRYYQYVAGIASEQDLYEKIRQDDLPANNLSEVQNNVRVIDACSDFDRVKLMLTAAKARGQCDIVFVDYLQLFQIKYRGKKAGWEVIGEISTGLKMLAARLNVPVVALCQLNREFEKDTQGGSDTDRFPSPGLHNLRQSGSIEQDANAVLFLTPETFGDARNRTGDRPRARLTIAKNRHGRAGQEIPLEFDKAIYRFTELS